VNPYAFAPPIAPHLAAEAIGARIDLETIAGTVAAAAAVADLVVVEGVGGWLVPLGGATTVADLAGRLGAPVVLVVGLRLGCLSHALLTAESILHRGARLAGWVANTLDPGMAALDGNVRSLQARLPAPLLGRLPHVPGAPGDELASRLTLPT
jgi:dethiobiotin synthetase